MNSKPGFPDLSASDPLNDTPVPVSYKRGWSTDTDQSRAIQDTLTEVARLYPGREVFGEPEIIQTDEHRDANEYLVKILIL